MKHIKYNFKLKNENIYVQINDINNDMIEIVIIYKRNQFQFKRGCNHIIRYVVFNA
jgi:hypothetical protein